MGCQHNGRLTSLARYVFFLFQLLAVTPSMAVNVMYDPPYADEDGILFFHVIFKGG